jgi:hypothetical protein
VQPDSGLFFPFLFPPDVSFLISLYSLVGFGFLSFLRFLFYSLERFRFCSSLLSYLRILRLTWFPLNFVSSFPGRRLAGIAAWG